MKLNHPIGHTKKNQSIINTQLTKFVSLLEILPEQRINEAKAGDPLADSDPSDPGVDIGGLLRMTGGWKKIK